MYAGRSSGRGRNKQYRIVQDNRGEYEPATRLGDESTEGQEDSKCRTFHLAYCKTI